MITHPLVMLCPGPWSCELRFDAADPTAVSLVTPKGEWHMARDLLAAGMLGPAGCGDVRVRVVGEFAEFSLVKTWKSAWQRVRNETVLTAPVSQVEDFLGETFLAVPPDAEAALLADELAELERADRWAA